MTLEQRQYIMPSYGPPDVEFTHGEGVRLYGTDNITYLDFISGIAVNSLGHAHPKLKAALSDQLDKIWHLSNMFRIPGQERLAERYCEATFADRVFFTNSGAEAIECAIKAARRYHFDRGEEDRYEILTFTGAFHGRTLGAINAGGNPNYLKGFGPALPGFTQLEFGDIEALKNAVTDKTAGILIEPVQGEGGLREVPEEDLKLMRKLCDESGALLMYDEVQSGAGRTGYLFAHQEFEGAEPDIMAIAKGVGGGFPMGACLMTEAVGQGMVKGTHGSTFGGNPLAMAVGNAVWDELSNPDFLAQVRHVAGQLTQGLASLQERYDSVIELRGRGLLRGVAMKEAPGSIIAKARENGLLIGVAGGTVIRMAPPLIITEEDAREAVAILDDAIGSEGG